jgi:hypothetical protein
MNTQRAANGFGKQDISFWFVERPGMAAEDSERLRDFIASAKQRGLDDAAITMMLRHEGWSERKIQDALVAQYKTSLDLDVPRRGGRSESAREAFLYLLSFAMLAVWSAALVSLADQLIEHAYPSNLSPFGYEYSRQSVALQLASLIVAFPIYLWIQRLLAREMASRPETIDSGVRKWLTYIALVIAAATLVGDAVGTLSTYLGGDLTARFVFEALVLLVVAGGIFWYYLGTVREDVLTSAGNRILGIAATCGVVLAIILGFTGIGSPSHQRDVSADQQRVQNLGLIASLITSQTERGTKPLPKSLREITASSSSIRDPISNDLYGYIPVDDQRYRLCAVFATDDRLEQQYDTWRHPAGRYCYELSSTSALPSQQ